MNPHKVDALTYMTTLRLKGVPGLLEQLHRRIRDKLQRVGADFYSDGRRDVSPTSTIYPRISAN
jgi:hypothetical protein